MLDNFIYFEKKVTKTTDRKKKNYPYGTIVVRSKQLNNLLDRMVRVVVIPIEPNKQVPWTEIEEKINQKSLNNKNEYKLKITKKNKQIIT